MAYRCRVAGRGSRRIQQGGFASERDAREALERALERLRREKRVSRSLTLRELVDEYLAQHEAEPETIEKLRWLLAKSVPHSVGFESAELRSHEIANWRMTAPSRAQVRGDAGASPGTDACGRVGNDRRQPGQARRRQSAASKDGESAVRVVGGARGRSPAQAWGAQAGPMVIFAAATGLRPGEWIALEWRDVDLDERVVYVRRAYRNGRIKHPKTQASMRSVPLQDVALAALERVPANEHTPLLFPATSGGYFDLHNFRGREWKPAQQAAGIAPSRRVDDLRHTFATFALRAGISTFALSRYMGASLTMIDRHYGHLTIDGGEHARRLLDSYGTAQQAPWTLVDARWTSEQPERITGDNRNQEYAGQ